MSGCVPLLPLYALMAWRGKNVPFTPLCYVKTWTVYSNTILPVLPRCESCLSEVKGKGVSWHVQHAQRGGRGIAVVLLNPDNRSGSVVKATLGRFAV